MTSGVSVSQCWCLYTHGNSHTFDFYKKDSLKKFFILAGGLVILGKQSLLSGSESAWAADFSLNSNGTSVLAQLSSDCFMQLDCSTAWALKMFQPTWAPGWTPRPEGTTLPSAVRQRFSRHLKVGWTNGKPVLVIHSLV